MQPSHQTLLQYFEKFASERGDDLFLFDEKRRYTVGQALCAVKSLAAQLQKAGVERGDFVAVKADRTVENVLLFYALQIMGGVAVLCDPHEGCERYRLRAEGDTLFVDGVPHPLDGSAEGTAAEFCSDSQEASVVIFTSGSTGERKAVCLSQYNFINNSLDSQPIGGYCADDVNILIVPIHHVFGIALIVTAVVTQHAIFVPSRVDFDYVLDCMERYGVTRLNGVPSMYLALAEKKGTRTLSSLRCGLIAGAPCSKEQFLNIEAALGMTLVPVYGMSEFVGISCGNAADHAEDRCNNVGKVYSMNEVQIGADGEILAKGPALTEGYWKDGKITPAVDENGWLHTGDLGALDDRGYLFVNGRKKDIIIRNGNNLSVVAIEQKLLRLPQIRDVCVVGVSDEKEGEVPCAAVVWAERTDDWKSLFLSVLSKPELPKRCIFSERIPLTATGKHDRQTVLREFRETSDPSF